MVYSNYHHNQLSHFGKINNISIYIQIENYINFPMKIDNSSIYIELKHFSQLFPFLTQTFLRREESSEIIF